MPSKGHSQSTDRSLTVSLDHMNKQSPPKKLARSRTDRYIGGVAAGIASRFDVDPIFVRIAFLASLAFGGLGLLAYVVLLAVMPVEGDPSDPMPPIDSKRRNQMIGLAVVVGLIALVTADSGSFAAWVFGFWPGVVFGVLFWVAASCALIWLLASGAFSRDKDPSGTPSATAPATGTTPSPSPDGEGSASTEVVTYAESPSQLSTEVMETRQMASGSTGTNEQADDEAGRGSAGSPPAPVRDDAPSTIGKIMVWFAIGVAALIVFCVLFVFSAGTTALFGGVPMAALVIILGGGMVFAGLRGRRQISLWLLAAAIAVTLPMAAVSIADLRVEGSYGDIKETPMSVVDVPSDGYEMAAGNMTIDLRKFDFANQPTLDLPVRSGMGLTSVIVPDRVCVSGDVTGKAGVISIRGRQSNGIDISQTASLTGATGPGPVSEVRIDGEFKLGAFEVVDSTQWRQDGRGGSFEDNEFEPDESASAAARERAALCSAAAPSGPEAGKKKVRS